MADAVIDNPAEHRFELALGDDQVAAAYYRIEDGRVVLVHTEVPYEFSGQGIGTRLATGVFDAIRAGGRKAVLKCSFMQRFVASHPEYADIFDG
ncbi:MAG: N-acetyltransferase [Sphingopyxis sp.]|nr:N-acetyltransferase [Sphingopyxis sp.]